MKSNFKFLDSYTLSAGCNSCRTNMPYPLAWERPGAIAHLLILLEPSSHPFEVLLNTRVKSFCLVLQISPTLSYLISRAEQNCSLVSVQGQPVSCKSEDNWPLQNWKQCTIRFLADPREAENICPLLWVFVTSLLVSVYPVVTSFILFSHFFPYSFSFVQHNLFELFPHCILQVSYVQTQQRKSQKAVTLSSIFIIGKLEECLVRDPSD